MSHIQESRVKRSNDATTATGRNAAVNIPSTASTDSERNTAAATESVKKSKIIGKKQLAKLKRQRLSQTTSSQPASSASSHESTYNNTPQPSVSLVSTATETIIPKRPINQTRTLTPIAEENAGAAAAGVRVGGSTSTTGAIVANFDASSTAVTANGVASSVSGLDKSTRKRKKVNFSANQSKLTATSTKSFSSNTYSRTSKSAKLQPQTLLTSNSSNSNTFPLTTSKSNANTAKSTSKSILKVKRVVVAKTKSGSNKISRKVKVAPQETVAEADAAGLKKTDNQFGTAPETSTSLSSPETTTVATTSASVSVSSDVATTVVPTKSNEISDTTSAVGAPTGTASDANSQDNLAAASTNATKELETKKPPPPIPPPKRSHEPITIHSASSKLVASRHFCPIPTTSAFYCTKGTPNIYLSKLSVDSIPPPPPSTPVTGPEPVNAGYATAAAAFMSEQQQQSENEAVDGNEDDQQQNKQKKNENDKDKEGEPDPDNPSTSGAAARKRKINEENSAKTSSEAAATAGPSTSTQPAEDDKDKEEDKDAKKKKNRCAECRKKVGLTGFQCRCGGLYCAVHRYSDKHDCTFNYREHGAQEIRRNNPVVVGEKIQKI